MSTKIYNGFRLTHTDLFQIHDAIDEWKDELKPMITAKLSRVIAAAAATRHDEHFFVKTSSEQAGYLFDPLRAAFADTVERQSLSETTGIREPDVDMNFDIFLFPHAHQVFGIVDCDQGDFVQTWMNKSFVEEFSYWNGSDGPEDISPATWEARGKVWNDIFAKRFLISKTGMQIRCSDVEMPSYEDVLKEVPSFERRAQHVAQLNFTRELLERSVGDRDVSTCDIMTAFNSAISERNSHEFANRIEQAKILMADKRDLTMADLMPSYDPNQAMEPSAPTR